MHQLDGFSPDSALTNMVLMNTYLPAFVTISLVSWVAQAIPQLVPINLCPTTATAVTPIVECCQSLEAAPVPGPLLKKQVTPTDVGINCTKIFVRELSTVLLFLTFSKAHRNSLTPTLSEPGNFGLLYG